MTEREQLEQSIAALEAQRAVLGDVVVDSSIAALREKLTALFPAPRSEQQRKQVMNWIYGTQENHGLLFAGPKEDFSHPYVGLEKCVNYYEVELRLELYDKSK